MRTTNIALHSAIYYASPSKITNAHRNMTSRTTSDSTSATRTAPRADPSSTCHTHTRYSPEGADIASLSPTYNYARRRDITRNPLPYSIVKDAVVDLMDNRNKQSS